MKKFIYAIFFISVVCVASYLYCTISFNDKYPNDYKQIEQGLKI